MKLIHHPLLAATPGTRQELVSLHFGQPGAGPKVTIQASLHADEVPGMLVAQHLRRRLEALEAAGQLRGEVVLVPAANPIGLHQWLLRDQQGRFELASGQNFNRHYADLTDTVAAAVQGRLGADAAANVQTVRAALRAAVAALPASGALESLRKTLYGLAIDADIVLDLHCDGEAVMHFYTTPDGWPQAEPLARCMGAQAVLLATSSGDEPFDEACSMVWTRLAERVGPAHPLPPACTAVTIELRGEGDVSHALAAQDAAAIEHFLQLRGVIAGTPAELPPLRCEATPLAGSMPIHAPQGGVLVFLREPGDRVKKGEPIVELIDPFSGEVTVLVSPVDGLLYARERRRFAVAGMPLAKVAGREALRQGLLLSA
ncbi:succinylglutamate desuccinylase/aspartoacylase family protein [Aquabacterium sp.]|uniref:succinylglutamate desuccinylase/aspartoacylase family protein n=1 Tax=Aquabacterium sp. TaxID=1872578 RepID=UPI002B5AD653|nr:succinylglutamate desuccinylase/aspartoacylase family protein [Aquabacterium sp.]HSW04356.1 succinylglutamate desuccinylase/aspartoacylase family protein [Aquabacterium sp.]